MTLAPQRPTLRRHKWWGSGQPRDPQQGVANDGQAGDKAHLRETAHFHLAYQPTVLAPADDLLDPLAQSLARPAARMVRSASVARSVNWPINGTR